MFVSVFLNVLWLVGVYSLHIPTRLFSSRRVATAAPNRSLKTRDESTTKLWTTVLDGSGKSSKLNISIPPLSYSVFGENLPKVDNKPLFARLVSWVVKRLVETRTQFVSGLSVDVLSNSNRDIIRGRVDTLEMKFDKIAFGQFFVSGGGRLILRGLDLRMRRFLFQDLQSLRRPYQIYGDFLLTQSDIVNSKFIRNLIQLLVNTILERVLKISDETFFRVNIKKVSIRQRRLFAQGEVSTSGKTGATLMNFEVSTGAGVRDDGQVIFLRDIQVVLNPDSILRAAVPILLTTPIDVDLGEDCRVESLVIANKHIWLRANSKISPVTPFAVTPVSSKALYRYDLAALLSNVIRIPAGVAVPFKGWFRRVNGAITSISNSLGAAQNSEEVEVDISSAGSLEEPEEDETPAERRERSLKQQQQRQAQQVKVNQQQKARQQQQAQLEMQTQRQQSQQKSSQSLAAASPAAVVDDDSRPRALGKEPSKGPRNTVVIRPSTRAALQNTTGVVEDTPHTLKSPLPLSLPLPKSLPLPRPLQAP
jgi:hypothetical protein